MALTTYTYTLSEIVAGINASQLADEIRALAAGGSLVTGLYDVQTDEDSDELRVIFNAALSAAERTVLDGTPDGGATPSPPEGVIGDHVPVADDSPQAVSVVEFADVVGGAPRVHPSPRPSGMTTYFSSHGDVAGAGGVGGGTDKLLFKMGAGDASKSVDLTFNSEVYIKDGWIFATNAPLGAMVSAEVYHPSLEVKLGAFVCKTLIRGTGWSPFDTEDFGTLPQGFRLRLTVFNSSGTGDDDAPAAFDVIARVEMFRALTV